MLGVYFKVWRDLLKAQNPSRTLYYVDIFCGDGETFDKTTRETFETPVIVSLMKKGVIESELDIRFFLNDKNSEAIKKLQTKIKELGLEDRVIDIDNIDANLYVDKILGKLPADGLVIFFIDPFNYKELKWTTLEKISKHGNNYGRKPEIIINLPLYSLGEAQKSKSYEKVDEFFGTEKWLEKVNENKQLTSIRPVFNALLDTYVSRIKGLGYRVEYEEISSIGHNSPVYYIIFAVANDEAYTIVKRAIAFVRSVKIQWEKDKVAKKGKITGVGSGSGLDKWVKNSTGESKVMVDSDEKPKQNTLKKWVT